MPASAELFTVRPPADAWAQLAPYLRPLGRVETVDTASAAGLLTELHSAPYAVTKHAALAFAEWLAVTYGDRGIKVACLCPEGVWTPMIQNAPILQQTAVTTDVLVEETLKVLHADGFLITTHDTTLKSFQNKARDYGEWISKMRHLRTKAMALLGQGQAFKDGEAPRTEGRP